MGNECEGGTCGPSDCGSSCESGGSCACESSCGDSCECPSPDELAMMVGKMAMVEALKDRVRKKIEAGMGKKLDNIADLIVEGFGEHMKEHQAMGKKQDWMNRMMKAMME